MFYSPLGCDQSRSGHVSLDATVNCTPSNDVGENTSLSGNLRHATVSPGLRRMDEVDLSPSMFCNERQARGGSIPPPGNGRFQVVRVWLHVPDGLVHDHLPNVSSHRLNEWYDFHRVTRASSKAFNVPCDGFVDLLVPSLSSLVAVMEIAAKLTGPRVL
ncbi:hypothetical protein BV25DRAFT_625182 [Artomyces pyxidatus]|uniref:Uncharacterized protein n=1 Tax=Artomyces pyxidatus TaxID=48021 RepID=A0ACB8T2T1_9AGAM|nr:hypothetical protein BV25DRAFT_625182 [Artomyces pyxidatus]